MRPLALVCFLSMLVAPATGCGEKDPANQLLFWVVDASPTGLRVPEQLERFTLTVSSVGGDGGLTERYTNGWPLMPTDSSSSEGIVLPESLAVLPEDSDMPNGSVLVELEAFSGVDLILRYSLVTNFGLGLVEHDLPIDPACFDVLCGADERCQAGSCVRF